MENEITNMEWLCEAMSSTLEAQAQLIEAWDSVRSVFGENNPLSQKLSEIDQHLSTMSDLCYEMVGNKKTIEPEDLQRYLTSDK